MGTGRFAGDGTREEAPQDAAGTPAATARDAHGRPVSRRNHPPLWEPFLALACPGYRTRGGGPGARRVAGGREAAARLHGCGGGRESLVRARDRSRRRRADPASATRGGDGFRNDHTGSRDRHARLARHSRAAAGRVLAWVCRSDRPRDHARAAPVVHPCVRACAGRLRACGRLAGHPRTRRAADCVRPLLHAPVCRHGGTARFGVRLGPRHFAAALPRRRAPLLRPGCACRLGAPTEEA